MIPFDVNILLVLSALLSVCPLAARETITFPSPDSLEVTADLYIAHQDLKTPLMVLFHQAGWSRGEYREIAPKLNVLGYNCMAVDQRSGDGVNEVPNETARRAAKAGKGTTYLDARQDMIAALAYARRHFAKGKLIAWGSSYSAALVLQIAGEQPGLVDGVLAFAPGEYFGRSGKPGNWIQESAKNIRVPVFITSARDERDRWAAIFQAIPGENKGSYIPETPGNHGSRALWEKFADSPGYWQAVTAFLKKYFPE